jgi:hypothetical protein
VGPSLEDCKRAMSLRVTSTMVGCLCIYTSSCYQSYKSMVFSVDGDCLCVKCEV